MFILESGGLGFADARYALQGPARLPDVSLALLTVNQARIAWLSSANLFTAAACIVLAVSILLMRTSLTRRGFFGFMLTGTGLGMAGLLHLSIADTSNSDLALIFHLTFDSIQATQHFSEADLSAIARLVSLINALAVIVPGFLMLAGCSLVLIPSASKLPDPRHFLQVRMSKLKSIMQLGSAMLVTGSLHLLLWSRLPIAFTDDIALQEAIGAWALSITQYCGITYSLMLTVLYIPCVLVLIERTETLLKQSMPALSEPEISDWLDKHGFSTEPLRHFPQIIAVLAPSLAGPISSSLLGLNLSLG